VVGAAARRLPANAWNPNGFAHLALEAIHFEDDVWLGSRLRLICHTQDKLSIEWIYVKGKVPIREALGCSLPVHPCNYCKAAILAEQQGMPVYPAIIDPQRSIKYLSLNRKSPFPTDPLRGARQPSQQQQQKAARKPRPSSADLPAIDQARDLNP
jgi:hypothetical protein